MNDYDLESKLIASDSYNSIYTEEQVCGLLVKQGWSATHSGYYKDFSTGKWREVDVCAHRMWKKSDESGENKAIVQLVLQCKSIKGYHILFTPASNLGTWRWALTKLDHDWVGHRASANWRDIARNLEEMKLNREIITSATKRFQGIAYPDGFVKPYDLMVKAQRARVVTSAFRETNIGSTKDLENSVLWRASLDIASVIESEKEERWGRLIKDTRLASVIETSEDIEEFVCNNFYNYLSLVRLFHPIIVLDAHMWLIKDQKLEALQWCRFAQHNVLGDTRRWFDIVSQQYYPTYISRLTKHYENEFKKVDAEERKPRT
jgi:hypothetical protein